MTDRGWVLTGIVASVGLAWVYLAVMATDMADTAGMTMAPGALMATPRTSSWTPVDFGLMLLMWSVMMVGMMLPSATPMILLFGLVNRRKHSRGYTVTPTAVFAGGYLAAWTAFSLVATMLQWGLHEAGLLSPMMMTTSVVLGGSALVATGVYQWTPLKTTCLRHCQSPLQFLSTSWRDGTTGALWMGWRHGLYCLGCCWSLMTLLFVGGVMNLLWIAGLTVFVLVEKVWPTAWISAVSGAVLVAWGGLVLGRELGV